MVETVKVAVPLDKVREQVFDGIDVRTAASYSPADLITVGLRHQAASACLGLAGTVHIPLSFVYEPGTGLVGNLQSADIHIIGEKVVLDQVPFGDIVRDVYMPDLRHFSGTVVQKLHIDSQGINVALGEGFGGGKQQEDAQECLKTPHLTCC